MDNVKLSKTQLELMRIMAAIEQAGHAAIREHNDRMMADPNKGAGYCITLPIAIASRTGVASSGSWAGNGAFRNLLGETIRGLSVRTYRALYRLGMIEWAVVYQAKDAWECSDGTWHLTGAGHAALAAAEVD